MIANFQNHQQLAQAPAMTGSRFGQINMPAFGQGREVRRGYGVESSHIQLAEGAGAGTMGGGAGHAGHLTGGAGHAVQLTGGAGHAAQLTGGAGHAGPMGGVAGHAGHLTGGAGHAGPMSGGAGHAGHFTGGAGPAFSLHAGMANAGHSSVNLGSAAGLSTRGNHGQGSGGWHQQNLANELESMRETIKVTSLALIF